MNIIECVKYLKEQEYGCIVKEDWRDGDSNVFEYYLHYNQYSDSIEKVSAWNLYSDYDNALEEYNFNMQDIEYKEWKIYDPHTHELWTIKNKF